MKAEFDVAIVGSGFSGSLLAMISRRLGKSVVMIERGSHPRFAIGESSTPLANLLLEQISTEYDLPRVLPLCKWGSWQKAYPGLGCGLKRGFTFYHHRCGEPWTRQADRANELLVAASPHDGVADTHWYRADFDHFLAREAQTLGVDYLDETELTSCVAWNDGVRLEGERKGTAIGVRARLVVDATGPCGFLHRALSLGAAPFGDLPPIEGLYSHFKNVRRWEEMFGESGAPYPPDDAAVHHVFPGGWIWVLRFNNAITSAGVAIVGGNELRLHEKSGWSRLIEKLPSIEAQFADASPVMPFVHTKKLPFRSAAAAGPNWALMPSAAGFIDPLLSTGFPLTLLGVQRLAEVIKAIGSPAAVLRRYQVQTFTEVDRAARLIGALYRNMDRPEVFNALTLLYFAAASFTETVHRLGKPELAGGTFLLGDHRTFAPAFDTCLHLACAGAETQEIRHHVLEAIEPVDVAGLSDLSRRNAYGVFASDLHRAANKLKSSPSEIDEMLARCGFIAKPTVVP